MSEFIARNLLSTHCFQCWKSLASVAERRESWKCARGCGAKFCTETCKRAFLSTLSLHNAACITACKSLLLLEQIKRNFSESLPPPEIEVMMRALAPEVPVQNKILLCCYAIDLSTSQRDRALFSRSIASTLFEFACLDEANRIFHRSIEFSTDRSAEIEKNIACCKAGIGFVHQARGEFFVALSLFEESLRIFRRFRGTENKQIVNLLNVYGSVLARLKRFDEALEKYELAIQMRKKLKDETSLNIALNTISVANVHFEKKDFARALPHYETASSLLQQQGGGQEVLIADLLHYVACCLAEVGRYDEAVDKYRSTLDSLHSLYGEKSEKVASCHELIGLTRQKQGKWNLAVEEFKISLSLLGEENSVKKEKIATCIAKCNENLRQ